MEDKKKYSPDIRGREHVLKRLDRVIKILASQAGKKEKMRFEDILKKSMEGEDEKSSRKVE